MYTLYIHQQKEGFMPSGKKYDLNENYFDLIDSPDKAYWLGFLTADASINKSNGALTLELASIDKDHLRKFIETIQSTHPIKDAAKNCCRICIGNKHMVKSLSTLGVVPNKTHCTQTPDIDESLLRHFYRGILDGDGWITNRYQSRGKINCEFGFSSGCEVFIHEIHDWIQTQLARKCGYIIHRQRSNGSVYQLTIGGNTLFKQLCKLFYEDATSYLDRKHDRVNNYLKCLQ